MPWKRSHAHSADGIFLQKEWFSAVLRRGAQPWGFTSNLSVFVRSAFSFANYINLLAAIVS